MNVACRHSRSMTEPSDVDAPPRQGWLAHLSQENQDAFQDGTVLIEILTGRVRTLGEVGLLDLAVAAPLDGQALAHLLAEHAGRALEQADILQQLSEQFEQLAVIAAAAPAA